MTKTLKTTLLVGLFFFGLLTGLQAQCKYEYKEKDVITNALNFVTEKFTLSSSEKKEKVYFIKNLTARFEKKGTDGSILINYGVMNTFGRLIVYTTQVDSLVIRFENGDIRTIKMNKMASYNMTSVSYKVDLSYQLDEAMIKALKSGTKIAAIRITSTNFNIDVSEFENQLSQKFNQCWTD